MNIQNTNRPVTRAERETQTAAERLVEQVDQALAAVTIFSSDSDDLESYSDRIERAARDLAVALREMAQERRQRNEER